MRSNPPPLLDEIATLVTAAACALSGEGVPAFAHLRVRSRGRERDYLLGFRTLIRDAVTVLNWQTAPLADAFFACTEGSDYEIDVDGRVLEGTVLARTLLGFDGGALASVETRDARWVRDGASWARREPAHDDAWLRPRGDEARARVASSIEAPLDPTQLAAVQRSPGGAMLVLGEAGAGKTTVALHRLAHLSRLRAFERAVVLVPTEGLRRLSESLLERLGVRDRVEVALYDRWAASQARRAFRGVPVRESQDAVPAVVRLKRHRALAVAIDALARRRAAPRDDGDEAPATTRRSKRVARNELLHLFGDGVLMQSVVDASDGAVAPRDTVAVLQHTRVQFSDTAEQTYADFVDATRLETLDGRGLDAGTPMEDAGTVDVEDYAVLFALDRARARARHEPEPELPGRYDCVVLDEAQEFAPLELALAGRALRPRGTLVIAGDAGQQVDPTACFADWSATMRDLGAEAHHTTRLETLYRSPPEVTALARRVLDPGDPRATSVRGDAIATLRAGNECHLVMHLVDALRALVSDDGRASAAVIARTPDAAKRYARLLARGLDVRLALDGEFRFAPGVNVTCVQEVKGLEFDYVLLPDATTGAYPDTGESRRALYVALTRAVHHVLIAAVGPLSPLLGAL